MQEPSPNEVMAGITGKGYLSPSQISKFQSCSLAWSYAYVEKAPPETTSATMVFGTAVHQALQRHLLARLCLEPAIPVEELVRTYRESFDKEVSVAPCQFARQDSAESLEAMAKQVLLAFLETPLAWPEGQVIGVEETLRIRLAEDLPDLVGRVDAMTLHEGTLTIVDYKTTRTLWSREQAESASQQLSLYAQAAAPIAEELGARIRLEFVLLTKHKEPRVEAIEVPADPEKVSRSTMVMRRVYRAMRSLNVYPSPSPTNCYACPYQRRCESWHMLEPEVNR